MGDTTSIDEKLVNRNNFRPLKADRFSTILLLRLVVWRLQDSEWNKEITLFQLQQLYLDVHIRLTDMLQLQTSACYSANV
jgi:hypothetical protein